MIYMFHIGDVTFRCSSIRNQILFQMFPTQINLFKHLIYLERIFICLHDLCFNGGDVTFRCSSIRNQIVSRMFPNQIYLFKDVIFQERIFMLYVIYFMAVA